MFFYFKWPIVFNFKTVYTCKIITEIINLYLPRFIPFSPLHSICKLELHPISFSFRELFNHILYMSAGDEFSIFACLKIYSLDFILKEYFIRHRILSLLSFQHWINVILLSFAFHCFW